MFAGTLREKKQQQSQVFSNVIFLCLPLTWITEKELERVIKKRWRILLKKKHENFIAAVRKWEMLAVSKERPAGWKWAVVKKNYKRPRTQATKFLVSTYGNSSSSRAKRHCGRAKQQQRTVQKRGLHVHICFFANRSINFVMMMRCLVSPMFCKWLTKLTLNHEDNIESSTSYLTFNTVGFTS